MVVPAPAVVAAPATTRSAASAAWTLTSLVLAVMAPPTSLTLAAWTRIAWAYGFTLAGVTVTLSIGLLMSSLISSSRLAKAPAAHVETSQRFRPAQ